MPTTTHGEDVARWKGQFAQEREENIRVTERAHTAERENAKLVEALEDFASHLDAECGTLLPDMAGDRERAWRGRVSGEIRALLASRSARDV